VLISRLFIYLEKYFLFPLFIALTINKYQEKLSKSNFDFIKELLEKGADINVKNKNGMTPLIFGI
jgi:ankyrin repeat protein